MMKIALLLSFFLVISSVGHSRPVRLKELVNVKGVRENPIVGYGLVIGLSGTGDSGGEITNKSLKRMFQKLGLNPESEIASKNVAAVIVTGKLPEFAKVGQKLDVQVSSVGDASSLAGGTLLVTPLKGGDGKVYAIANGSMTIGGTEKGNVIRTSSVIPSGAIVERALPYSFEKNPSIRLTLKNPDFTTSARIEKIINQELGGKYAKAKDSSTVDVIIPAHYERKVVPLMAIIENFKVITDQKAKIVINERTGTVVAGGNVSLKPVAISHKGLSISIGDKADKNSAGNTLYYVEEKTTLKDLVSALNAFGVGPEDLVSIFYALKRNGALVGEIELI